MDKHESRASTLTSSGQPGQQDLPHLSCQLCRDRKVKCDKLDPCSNCASAGVICVPIHRLRLPRGRHAPRAGKASGPSGNSESRHAIDDDLKSRVGRLEVLVEKLSSGVVSKKVPHGPMHIVA